MTSGETSLCRECCALVGKFASVATTATATGYEVIYGTLDDVDGDLLTVTDYDEHGEATTYSIKPEAVVTVSHKDSDDKE
jgi:hypothetical protein